MPNIDHQLKIVHVNTNIDNVAESSKAIIYLHPKNPDIVYIRGCTSRAEPSKVHSDLNFQVSTLAPHGLELINQLLATEVS